MVMSALFIAVLMIMASFAVDVSAWYSRTTQVQRAADSAALAGVVFMPDLVAATTAATTTLAKNGFTAGVSGVTVDINPVPGYPRQLEVSVGDTDVDQYFSGAFTSSPKIVRRSVAEYITQVPLGSPDNLLGNDPVTGVVSNLWASISGPYTDKNNGDPFSTKCGAGSSGTTSCSGVANGEYRKTGFLYAIDITPAQVNQDVSVAIYDANHHARSSYPNYQTADNGDVNTQFELFDIDGTPATDSDNTVPGNSLAGKCSSGPGRQYIDGSSDTSSAGINATYESKWWTLCTVRPITTGHLILQVKSSDIPGQSPDKGSGWNQYSVKATVPTGTNPALFAIGDLSLFNNLPNNTLADTSASFYLSQIDPANQGKLLEVKLFDPGDGNSGNYDVNILKPNAAGTGWSITTCKSGSGATANATVTYGASGACTIVTRTSSGNTYQGKWLSILMDVDYSSQGNVCGTCWWKVRYDFAALASADSKAKPPTFDSPNDRTVWSAQILGDPVHIVS
jgi:hypothetical protein